MGLGITVWTARAVFVLYALSVWFRVPGRQLTASRFFWTAGMLLHVVHVLCALGLVHRWSQSDAYQHTVKITEQMVGLSWGAGLYVNYVFTAIWIVDDAWWWINRASYERRSRILDWLVHGFFVFMFFNATVVFVGTATRMWALLIWALLMAARFSPRRTRRKERGTRVARVL